MSERLPTIGWCLFDNPRDHDNVSTVDTYVRMRYLNIVRELHSMGCCVCEPYSNDKLYDVLVVTKLGLRDFDQFEAAARLHKERHRRVIFDLNVNYLDVWGEHSQEYLQPKPRQIEHARLMCKLADAVVADSAYLGNVASRYHDNVHVVTDNIDPKMFNGTKAHVQRDETVIGWCGVSVKSYHLTLVGDVLAKLAEIHPIKLLLISNEPMRFTPKVKHEFRIYDYNRLPADILECDLGISPKIMNNSYELGHTEFKVATFMAQGVPVIASPQPSYLQAIRHGESGYIASTKSEWRTCLARCIGDVELRNRMGVEAREDVLQNYCARTVAVKYADAIRSALGEEKP